MAARLSHILRGCVAAPAAPDEPPAYLDGVCEQRVHTAPPKLLSDSQIQQFVATGFLTLPVEEFSAAFHTEIHARAEELWSTQLNYGNTRNIYPVLPALERVMHGPTVRGALTSVLGDGYVMDRRKHMHNSSSQGEQAFHKDCQRGKSLTGHRTRCVFAFYLPFGCDDAMGPTTISPGSQYIRTPLDPTMHGADDEEPAWESRRGQESAVGENPSAVAPHLRSSRVLAPVGSGSVTIMHYEMTHRGTARVSDEITPACPFRPLFKFLFERTTLPQRDAPSWNHQPQPAAALPVPDWRGLGVPYCMRAVVQSMWDFHLGRHTADSHHALFQEGPLYTCDSLDHCHRQ
jgi:hypothetical protein